jgi:hypothetical protein
MMRKTFIASFALAAVGLIQPSAASARGGGVSGHGGGFGGCGFHGVRRIRSLRVQRRRLLRRRRLLPSPSRRDDTLRLEDLSQSKSADDHRKTRRFSRRVLVAANDSHDDAFRSRPNLCR